ncbi:Endonuclease III-like protein [Exophiala dermatitidis]
MRTSRISQDTTRIFNAVSHNARTGRTTRSAKRIASFALGFNGETEVQVHEDKKMKPEAEEDDNSDDNSTLSALSQTPDIEDALSPELRPRSGTNRKRKLGAESPHTARSITTAKTEVVDTTARRGGNTTGGTIKTEEIEGTATPTQAGPRGRSRAKPKTPARKTTLPSGTVRTKPPSNWNEIYEIVKAMRQRNPTAPVDTMGCEELFWPTAPPRDKRYHTLTSLMLSSQTKDTVTAVAMHRLHTELVSTDEINPEEGEAETKQSQLTIDNIISCDPKHLDNLIGKVGFHNNKTKYIKQAALILKERFNSDIPDTIEGLVSLPGVGPKMAYLCMSAAWGRDEGIGVDVHVHRITNLWGWHKTKTPEETRACLEAWLPRDKWHEINKMLVGLGQTVCLPVGRKCGECDLAGTGLCKAEIRGWKSKVTQKTTVVKGPEGRVKVEFDEGVVKQETLGGGEQTARVQVKMEEELG